MFSVAEKYFSAVVEISVLLVGLLFLPLTYFTGTSLCMLSCATGVPRVDRNVTFHSSVFNRALKQKRSHRTLAPKAHILLLSTDVFLKLAFIDI